MNEVFTKNLKLLFCLSFLVFPLSSMGLIKLNVETLMKNYIDEGLVLSSEHNVSKIFEEGREVFISLGDKLKLNILVEFQGDILSVGPSDLVSISGNLTYYGNFKEYKVSLEEKKLRLGQKETYFIELDKGRKLEVYLMPTIKGFYGSE